MTTIRKTIGSLFGVREAHVYGGLALMALGAALAYPPAGAIVFGAGLAFLGLRGGR